jgi:hypothetical protein
MHSLTVSLWASRASLVGASHDFVSHVSNCFITAIILDKFSISDLGSCVQINFTSRAKAKNSILQNKPCDMRERKSHHHHRQQQQESSKLLIHPRIIIFTPWNFFHISRRVEKITDKLGSVRFMIHDTGDELSSSVHGGESPPRDL